MYPVCHEIIMSSSRTTWLLIAAASLAVMLGCIYLMSKRIAKFHHDNPRDIYAFKTIDAEEFQYAGHTVSIEQEKLDAEHEEKARAAGSAGFVVLKYGDSLERIRVEIPNTQSPGRDKIPGLKRYEDWLKVLRMANTNGQSPESFMKRLDTGEIPDRLIIVTRIPFPGSDRDTWGEVWKKDWQFDFRELTPDGTIRKYERLNYPTTRGVQEPKPRELHENTWQFQAALQLMPQAGQIGPTHNFFNNGIAAAGWTMPAAAFSGLLATIALVFGLGPQRKMQTALAVNSRSEQHA